MINQSTYKGLYFNNGAFQVYLCQILILIILNRDATTGSAEKYVNVQTKLPLFVSSNSEWTYDSQNRIVETKNNVKALDRSWGGKDGDNVGWWNKHGADIQKFDFVLVQ